MNERRLFGPDGLFEDPTYQGTPVRTVDMLPETRLRAALVEALAIAHGSGADFTRDVVDRLRELKRISEE